MQHSAEYGPGWLKAALQHDLEHADERPYLSQRQQQYLKDVALKLLQSSNLKSPVEIEESSYNDHNPIQPVIA